MRRHAPAAAILSLLATPALAAPQVVTDLVPTGALVQDVMGDLAEVRVLLPQGASAHHYQMRPSDAQALQSADLIIWMGPQLTPWLDRAAGTLSGTEHPRLLEVEGTTLRAYASDHDDHDHAHDDHAHDDHGDHAGDDPHAWLNPANAAPWLDAIATTLSAQDPDNAATYRANADAAAARIAALEVTLRDRLAPHAEDQFVVFHDAYGYFTDHFGLTPSLAVSLGDASTPSAGRIDAMRRQIVDSNAVCAFPEYAHDPALIDTVIEGSATRLGGALSPEGGALAPGAGQYEVLLTQMADTIIDCLAGE